MIWVILLCNYTVATVCNPSTIHLGGKNLKNKPKAIGEAQTSFLH